MWLICMGPESSGKQAKRLIVTCRTTLDATLRLFVPVVWLMMLLQYFYLIHYCFLFNKILICSIHLTRLKYYGHKHQQDLKINTVYHIIVSICRGSRSSFAICACCIKSFCHCWESFYHADQQWIWNLQLAFAYLIAEHPE